MTPRGQRYAVEDVCRGRGEGGGKLTPDLHVDVGDGLAGVDVEDLDVQGKVDAGLVLGHILPDVLTSHVYHSCQVCSRHYFDSRGYSQ